MKYTLRQLEIFLAIAKERNISRAAELLFMSQSAASAALQQLEQRHDILLFDRIGKSLVLNRAGESLRPKAEALVAHAKELQQELEEQQSFWNLNVGASLTIGNYLAVGYLSEYLAAHADAQVKFEVNSTPEIVNQVLNYALDIGLVEGEVTHNELDVIPWREDQLHIFCSSNHPLASKQDIKNKDLVAAKWVLREPGSGARQSFERAMHKLLPRMNIYLELTHNEAIKRAVETGIGIGCLSEIALESGFRHKELVSLPIRKKELKRRFYIVLRKNRQKSQAVEWWMELCSRLDDSHNR